MLLLVVLLVLVVAILALGVTQQLQRRKNPRRDPGLRRAGRDDAQSATDAANSAINQSSWMRPGGF